MQAQTDCDEFLPDYVPPPGDIVLDSPLYQGVWRNTLACDLGLLTYSQQIDDFLRGATRIDARLADRLALCIGATPEFWLRRDAQYVAGCARLGLVLGTKKAGGNSDQ